MINKKEWKEFKDSGLLWFINSILHLFGWAIVLESQDREITNAYPARVNFRGFSEGSNTSGYEKVTKYLHENIDDLLKETQDNNYRKRD